MMKFQAVDRSLGSVRPLLEVFGAESGANRLVRTHDNLPPRVGKYICYMALQAPWRFDVDQCAARGVKSLPEVMEEEVVADLRSGRALLLIDLSNEGFVLHSRHFDELHQYLDQRMIPRSSTLVVSQNRLLVDQYLEHYGPSTEQVQFAFYDFFPRMVLDRLVSMPLLAAEPAPATFFLCLNATPRPHRVAVLAGLLNAGLLPKALVSFPGLDYGKESLTEASMSSFLAQHPKLSYLRPEVAQVLRWEAHLVDDFVETGNALWDRVPVEAYAQTVMSVVTETEMSPGTVKRISEKSVKAVAMGHPVVIFGNAGSLSMLRDFGFLTWGELFDESYDEVIDPDERFLSAMETLVKVGQRLSRGDEKWMGALRSIGRHNAMFARDTGSRRYDQEVGQALFDNLGATLHDR